MTVPAPVLALLGTWEMVFIGFVLLLFFGAAKLPGIARSLGRSVNEFKAGMKDEPKSDLKSAPSQDADSSRN